jgi:two-component system response regulator PilR (NtrC family)
MDSPLSDDVENPVKILVVDDEESIRALLSRVLTSRGYDVQTFARADAALEHLNKEIPNIVISDVVMPGIGGIEFLENLKEADPEIQVILITGFADIETAVNAIKLGAFDYIQKPLDLAKIALLAERALERQSLKRENRELRRLVRNSYSETGIIGSCPGIKKVHDIISRVADGTSSILIEGESGTGKELIARAIHFTGKRAKRPFTAANLTAIPETLIESELFGHVKGAFTGAHNNRTGLFAQAENGSVFLDEIGDIPLSFQAKLLRVLQEKEFKPVGSDKTIQFTARVIAATNKDLKSAIKDGSFREDLYFRLNVITVRIPPLRDRKDDIPLLASHFAKKISHLMEIEEPPLLDKSLIRALKSYRWPGNVRELENTVERMLALSGNRPLTVDDLPEEISGRDIYGLVLSEGGTMAEIEKRAITLALERAGGKRLDAAGLLGLSKSTFYRKIKQYGLDE